jgi:hypothetical protein
VDDQRGPRARRGGVAVRSGMERSATRGRRAVGIRAGRAGDGPPGFLLTRGSRRGSLRSRCVDGDIALGSSAPVQPGWSLRAEDLRRRRVRPARAEEGADARPEPDRSGICRSLGLPDASGASSCPSATRGPRRERRFAPRRTRRVLLDASARQPRSASATRAWPRPSLCASPPSVPRRVSKTEHLISAPRHVC